MQKRIAPTPSAFPTTSLRRRIAAGTLLSGLVLTGAACGDDDGTAAAGPTVPGSGLAAAACDAYVDFNGAFASAPQDPAEMQAFGESLVPIVDTLAEALPDALQADAAVVRSAVAAVAEEGNPEALFGPEGAAAQTAIGAAVFEGCDAEQVEVTAVDYAFEGIPDELPAGRIAMEFRNEGVEEHEVILLRRNDGSEATFEELVELGSHAIFGEAAFTGVAFAPPSATAYTALDLEPGTYFLVCTIPVGGAEDGAPHAAHGMHQTIEVV